MGFFASTTQSYSQSNKESIPVDEEYVTRVIRLPSISQEYENAEFRRSFSQCIKRSPQPANDRKKRFSFRTLFRRKSEPALVQSPSSMDSDKENIVPQAAVDEVLSEVMIEPTEIIRTQRRTEPEIQIYQDYDRKNETNEQLNEAETHSQNEPAGGPRKKKTLRERLFGVKPAIREPTPLNSPFPSSSVYEAQETLTQRYMTNNYEKLMSDLDAIPFEFTIKEDNSTFTKISKAVQSFSPKKNQDLNEDGFDANSLKFKSTDQVEKCLETETSNPYDVAKMIKQMDSISITSSEHELTSKHNIKVGNQRPHKMRSIVRSFSRRLSLRGRRTSLVGSDNYSVKSDDDTKSDTFIFASESHFKPLNCSSSTLIKADSFFNPFDDGKTASSDQTITIKFAPKPETKFNKLEIEEKSKDPKDSSYSGSTKINNSSSEGQSIVESIYDPNPKLVSTTTVKPKRSSSFNSENFKNLLSKFKQQVNEQHTTVESRSLKARGRLNTVPVSAESKLSSASTHSVPDEALDAFHFEPFSPKDIEELQKSILQHRQYHNELINAPFRNQI